MKLIVLVSMIIGTFSLNAELSFLYRSDGTEKAHLVHYVSDAPENLTERQNELIEHVHFAVFEAENKRSRLPPEIFEIDGMSSSKGRCFLNNLCRLPHTRYLEIGCWKGSTFVSALYQNKETIDSAIGIDNWSQFNGPREEFEWNCSRFISNIAFQFYTHDCFKIDPKTFISKPINIYFYDGGHNTEDQANAFLHFNDVFEDVFIAIVDDWIMEWIREGTFKAFSELGYTILYEEALLSSHQDKHQWWNGCYIAVIKK